MSFSDFSSWPRDQEQSFVVYEQQQSESRKKSLMFGAIAGVLVFIFMVGVYAGVEPDKKDLSKDMNMSNLSKKGKKEPAADAPKADAPKADAPKADAPKADAPKTETPAPAPAAESK